MASTPAVFLPDFCAIRMVFVVVVVGQLLAFVLTLSARGEASPWAALALVSLFVQWVALSSAMVLCVARRHLARLGDARAGAVAYVLVLLMTAALSEAAFRLLAERVWLDAGAMLALLEGREPVAPSPLVIATGHAEFVLRNVAIAAIVTAVAFRYFYVQHQWRMRVESEARARIQALQSRIRPHFLFNSMNTIASLARSRPEVAEQVTEDLADLFRASLADARIPVALGDEIALCHQYLRIERQRLGPRLEARWDVDALPADARLPRLIIQPLLENAVYHGVEPVRTGGRIDVEGTCDGDLLRIVVSNPLPDDAPSVAGAAAPARRRPGNRIAMDNVRERLRVFFGPRGTVRVEARAGRFCVELTFPYVKEAPMS
ncbi:MAG: histidine kinase [Ectothiorhodospiraceae bacterium]|nr:histidine kinase [Chromatiales bacterium]MCP5153274.1 histidine kinase [Ectothiorhodospiraceae bacterium]